MSREDLLERLQLDASISNAELIEEVANRCQAMRKRAAKATDPKAKRLLKGEAAEIEDLVAWLGEDPEPERAAPAPRDVDPPRNTESAVRRDRVANPARRRKRSSPGDQRSIRVSPPTIPSAQRRAAPVATPREEPQPNPWLRWRVHGLLIWLFLIFGSLGTGAWLLQPQLAAQYRQWVRDPIANARALEELEELDEGIALATWAANLLDTEVAVPASVSQAITRAQAAVAEFRDDDAYLVARQGHKDLEVWCDAIAPQLIALEDRLDDQIRETDRRVYDHLSDNRFGGRDVSPALAQCLRDGLGERPAAWRRMRPSTRNFDLSAFADRHDVLSAELNQAERRRLLIEALLDMEAQFVAVESLMRSEQEDSRPWRVAKTRWREFGDAISKVDAELARRLLEEVAGQAETIRDHSVQRRAVAARRREVTAVLEPCEQIVATFAVRGQTEWQEIEDLMSAVDDVLAVDHYPAALEALSTSEQRASALRAQLENLADERAAIDTVIADLKAGATKLADYRDRLPAHAAALQPRLTTLDEVAEAARSQQRDEEFEASSRSAAKAAQLLQALLDEFDQADATRRRTDRESQRIQRGIDRLGRIATAPAFVKSGLSEVRAAQASAAEATLAGDHEGAAKIVAEASATFDRTERRGVLAMVWKLEQLLTAGDTEAAASLAEEWKSAGSEFVSVEALGAIVRGYPDGFEPLGTHRGEHGWFSRVRHVASGIDMKLIPSGTFVMGPQGESHETESRWSARVRLTRPYYMAITETTIGQWRSYQEASGALSTGQTISGLASARLFREGKWQMSSDVPASWSNPEPNIPAEFSDDHPVSSISWIDAIGFCRHYGLQLPTEAQWERACRGGKTSRFWWGNDEIRAQSQEVLVNWCEVGETKVSIAKHVRSATANPYGLYDMGGNVFEWVLDAYREGPPPVSLLTDPCESAASTTRIIKGGACGYTVKGSGYRTPFRFNAAASTIGFRVSYALSTLATGGEQR